MVQLALLYWWRSCRRVLIFLGHVSCVTLSPGANGTGSFLSLMANPHFATSGVQREQICVANVYVAGNGWIVVMFVRLLGRRNG